jgi:hypothetical protein
LGIKKQKQTELSKDLVRVGKNVQTLWDKIVALQYIHHELTHDDDYTELQGAMIYLNDVLKRLANKGEL